MTGGHNPTRRNRNIGTAKQGYGKSNQLAIPQPKDIERSYYETLTDPVIHKIKVHKTYIPVVVERSKEGFYHSCSPDDIELILNHIPQDDLMGLGLIVFRQPKNKEQILSPVWGRLIYAYKYKRGYHPAVVIEATCLNGDYYYPKKQSVEDQLEFEHLKDDGLEFKEDKRHFVASIDEEKVRSIQLYRTLLHEIGHYVHYRESIDRLDIDDEDWEFKYDQFWALPSSDKEYYANKYAISKKRELIAKGVIPFSRIEGE